MNTLRLEAEDAQEKVEELKGKVKTLEQENLSKEQEITSLNHRNQVLEGEVEKMESTLKEAKDAANQSAQHDTQNEALQRRLQILEEEAEEADRNLRETNEKYGRTPPIYLSLSLALTFPCVMGWLARESLSQDACANSVSFVAGSAKPMSRLVTTNARCRRSSLLGTSGRASTRRWRRSIPNCKRTCTTSRSLSATFKKNWSGYGRESFGTYGIHPFIQYTAFIFLSSSFSVQVNCDVV